MGVALEIVVKCPADCSRADDEIARHAISRPRWKRAMPRHRASIAVDHGWVTLTGTVHWQLQRVPAQRDIELLAGVSGITNNIAQRPLPPTAA